MQHHFKILITLCIALLLFSCASVDVREPPAEQPAVEISDAEDSTSDQVAATVPDGVDTKTENAQAKRSTATAVVGAVLATAATIWVVTEYIEDKVVPVVLTLVVAGLLYEASRKSDSATQN